MNNIFNNCCSAVITDVCDRMSIDYTVIPNLRTRYNRKKMYGKVRTMTLREDLSSEPNLDLGLDLIQDLVEGDILFVQGSDKFAYFGELLGLYCNQNNVSGVVINGRTRDSFSFKNYTYPVYCRGFSPIDIVGRGRVDQINCRIETKEFGFNSEDFIFCDWEGCVVLSQKDKELIIPEIKKELDKENKIKSLILAGEDLKKISKKIKYI